jgi:hypothetical protein
MKIEEYTFGQIYEEKINKEDIEKFATLFGEGSKALTELIKYCIENDIRTFASCKGHPEDKNILERKLEQEYIAFRINEDTSFASYLLSMPHRIKKIEALIENYNGKNSITLYVPATKKDESEKYFKEILDDIKKYNKNIEINKNIKEILEYVTEFPSDEHYIITQNEYKKFKRINGMMVKQIAKCKKNEETKKLQNKLCEILGKPKNIKELINYQKR